MASRKIAFGVLMIGLVYGGAAAASQVGGLATLVGPGGAVVSATVAYGERDVKDGRDDTVSNLRTVVRAQFGVLDGLDLYGLAGFTDLRFDHADFEGSRGGLFGGGLRYGVLNFPNSGLRLVLDLQGEYSRIGDDGKSVRSQNYRAATYVVKEYGAAGKVGFFYPYGGVQVSYAKYNGRDGIDNYRSKGLVGIFAGADYFVNPSVFFSGEVHLFDEMGVSVGAGYRF